MFLRAIILIFVIWIHQDLKEIKYLMEDCFSFNINIQDEILESENNG